MKAQPKQRSHLDFSAYGIVFSYFFLECIRGRILESGRRNIINIDRNNIYYCWKLLSVAFLFHKLYHCAVGTDPL